MSLIFALFACSAADDSGDKSDDGLGGVGYTEEAFADDFFDVLCDQFLACYDETTLGYMGITDKQSCLDLYNTDGETTGETVDCVYNADKAKECVNDYGALTCEELLAGTYPASCNEACPVEEE
jgi:hypothetical protein